MHRRLQHARNQNGHCECVDPETSDMASVQRHHDGAKDREILYAVRVRSRPALMPICFLDRIGTEAADLPAPGQNEAPAINADCAHQQQQGPTCKSQQHPHWYGHGLRCWMESATRLTIKRSRRCECQARLVATASAL